MNICIVGTGVVGCELGKLLHENRLSVEWKNLVFFGSKKSKGNKLEFMDKDKNTHSYTINHLETSRDFHDFNVALFCCSTECSKKYAEWAKDYNCFVIDNIQEMQN